MHVVVTACLAPERILGELKAYASRALNEARGHHAKRWSHHGSTRYLWEARHVAAAVNYAACQQGFPMALYVSPACEA